jgi:hypothetical protein
VLLTDAEAKYHDIDADAEEGASISTHPQAIEDDLWRLRRHLLRTKAGEERRTRDQVSSLIPEVLLPLGSGSVPEGAG